MGVCENERVHYFGVLIIRILLYMGTILGSPIFGNSHMGLIQYTCSQRIIKAGAFLVRMSIPGGPSFVRILKQPPLGNTR